LFDLGAFIRQIFPPKSFLPPTAAANARPAGSAKLERDGHRRLLDEVEDLLRDRSGDSGR
jgi:hypothetical protein